MTDAPELIWAKVTIWGDGLPLAGEWNHSGFGDPADTPYRRADLPPTMAEALTVPEVAALVHAAARVIDRYERWNGDRMGPAMRELRAAVDVVIGSER